MDHSAKRSVLVAARILIGLVSFSATIPLAADTPDHMQLAYLASFGNGSLESSVDRLEIGSLKTGHTNIARTNPVWIPENGTIRLGITRPPDLTNDIVSAGVFATPVNFGVGSLFGVRATFIKPVGPHQTGNVWGVAVAVRTGDQDDLNAATRTAAAFQVRAKAARLNVPGASVPANLPNLPQEIYDSIFDANDPEPFTLELVVDRMTGAGLASLKVGDFVVQHAFEFSAFRADSGPIITAVGPSIAIANAPGQSAFVRVRDFEILLSQAKAQNPSSAGCPPGWADFNCRAVPSN